MQVAGIRYKLVARVGAKFHAPTIELLELQNFQVVCADHARLTVLVAQKSSKWGQKDLHGWPLLNQKVSGEQTNRIHPLQIPLPGTAERD